jgi:hypothetical protein
VKYRKPPPPLGDIRITEWPPEMPRDSFVLLMSQSIDAAAGHGYDAPFDGPQLAAWLESPDIHERRKASYHIALISRSIEPQDEDA